MFKVRYTYVDPSSAGPFKGSMELEDGCTKGDVIHAPFGQALVTSCKNLSVERIDRSDLVQMLVDNYQANGQESTTKLFDKLIKKYKIRQHAIKTIIIEFRQAIDPIAMSARNE